ncbi:hypothetical protein GQ600_9705 [Phytophthora cactorum]|nr:hypothetical protein GQ600_9705 [Phytophthora cactorum]
MASLPKINRPSYCTAPWGKWGQDQQSRTREGLIKEARARFVRHGGAFFDELKVGQIKPNGVQVGFSNTSAKPNLDMRSLKTLKPMIGKELDVGTTHRGRY